MERNLMGLFRKKDNYDIICRDRNLKNIIDNFYQDSSSEYDYQDRIAFLVEDGIKFRTLLKDWLENEYTKHYSDNTCDIPNYKTFLSLKDKMIDAPEEYKNKSICVEGYVAYRLLPNAVFIYPIPCKNDVEKRLFYALADDLRATDSIILISEELHSLESGTHIRVYGIPSFYTPTTVHICVQKYEILD